MQAEITEEVMAAISNHRHRQNCSTNWNAAISPLLLRAVEAENHLACCPRHTDYGWDHDSGTWKREADETTKRYRLVYMERTSRQATNGKKS